MHNDYIIMLSSLTRVMKLYNYEQYIIILAFENEKFDLLAKRSFITYTELNLD